MGVVNAMPESETQNNFDELISQSEASKRQLSDSYPHDVPIFTVTQVTAYIKAMFERDEFLADLYVRGELSNVKLHSSGHLYFTLKDADTQIDCAMWRPNVRRLKFNPADGDLVIAHGYITVYPPRGRYQLYVDEIHFEGAGVLWERFEKLKRKLEAEGLFAKERKRPLPPFPRRVGVITSPDGAAIRDIVRVCRRRCPSVQLVLIPTMVQGIEAAPQIAAAIELANQIGAFDVLIVGRGGGSLEDLWAFNEEVVARAAAESHIPIVSAVGHETDFTILDFVADVRAPTPSAAAELVVPDLHERREQLLRVTQRLLNAMNNTVTTARQRLRALATRRVLTHPYEALDIRRQRVDELHQRMFHAMRNITLRHRQRFATVHSKLYALSPLAVLERGYALVRDPETGRVIVTVDAATVGMRVNVMLADGTLACAVEAVEHHER